MLTCAQNCPGPCGKCAVILAESESDNSYGEPDESEIDELIAAHESATSDYLRSLSLADFERTEVTRKALLDHGITEY